MKETARYLAAFWKEEDAVDVVEVILILVVLIGFVVIFRDQITTMLNKVLKKASTNADKI